MTEYFFELAGIRYRFLVPKSCVRDAVRSLSGYIAQPGPWDVECVISTPEVLSAPRGEHCFQSHDLQVFHDPEGELCYYGSCHATLEGAYLRILRQGKRSQIQLKASSIPKGITDDVFLICMQAVHHITEAGGFLLHASWIRYGEQSILFTGPSGIGKSTQAALWAAHRGAELINGDRAVIFPTEHGVEVRGVPYCGSSGVNKNRTIALGAVVYLSQAEENSITRLSGGQAFRWLWEGCSVDLWNQEAVATVTQTVADAVSVVPVYYLACTPDERAVQILEQALIKEGVL